MRFFASLMALMLAALAVALPLRAQAQLPPTGPVHVQPGQVATQKPTRPPQKPTTITSNVNEVPVPVTVRDSHGQLAIDLGPEDFQIYDDGDLVHIDHFDFGGDPVSVVLVVENSERIAPLLKAVQNAGIVFTDVVMGGNGRGAVIAFNNRPALVVPFTTNANRIQKAITDLKPQGSGAHLYDALNQAVNMLEEQPQGQRRRVIVAVSESVDTGSLNKLTSVLQDAELANISIYTVGLSSTEAELRTPPGQYAGPQASPPGTFARPGYPGTPQTPSTMAQASGNMDLLAVVETLAKLGIHLITPEALNAASVATGGDYISTFHDRSISEAMNRIGSELHAEYMLSFQAPSDGPWGYHKITVRVTRPGYRVVTRPGYFLSPPNGSTPAGS